MLSPADKLAAKKTWRRSPRNKAIKRPVVWQCKLRGLRESKRLSMRDVADAVGMSIAAIHQIEHGSDPMLSTATKLADFFGIAVGELWPERVKP